MLKQPLMLLKDGSLCLFVNDLATRPDWIK